MPGSGVPTLGGWTLGMSYLARVPGGAGGVQHATGLHALDKLGALLFEVLQDLNGQLGVLPDSRQDLNVLLVRLFRFTGGVLQRQPVLLRLAVARQQQHRASVGGLDTEEQVEEDERVGVP